MRGFVRWALTAIASGTLAVVGVLSAIDASGRALPCLRLERVHAYGVLPGGTVTVPGADGATTFQDFTDAKGSILTSVTPPGHAFTSDPPCETNQATRPRAGVVRK